MALSGGSQYGSPMGKVIRRTVTIRETWTIVWLPGEEPLHHTTTVDQEQPDSEEHFNEAIQTTLIDAKAAPAPYSSDASADPQPGSEADAFAARRRGKRTRVQRTKENR